jgi:long-chain acyl-CoA synthetase
MCAEISRAQQREPREVSSLSRATVTGDVCPPGVESLFAAVFGLELRSYWAAAEDVGATIAGDRPGPRFRVIPEATFTVVGHDRRPVPVGETGELVISSPTTSPGYWAEGCRIDPLPGGAFFTGDLVSELSDGQLEYVGRAKDLIVRSGSNISPREVEEALTAHPDVVDDAAAGIDDADLSQRVAALLVLRPDAGSSVTDILDEAARRLAACKRPEVVGVVDRIPRNSLTKVDRVAVTRLLEQASDRDGVVPTRQPEA